MSNPFVAEITMFAFNFAPKGWALCYGQLLPISQNTALFSLLGTNYGGDGKATFGLPNMQGNASVCQGQGPGLSPYFVGETVGVENVTLVSTEMATHNHGFVATTIDGTTTAASNNQIARAFTGSKAQAYNGNYLSIKSPNTNLNLNALTPSGSGFPHNNMQPYLTVNFCIALQGVYPPRG